MKKPLKFLARPADKEVNTNGRQTVKFALLNYSLSRDEIASIHRAGCQDIERNANRNQADVEIVEAETVEAVLDYYIDEEMQEMGWERHNVKVFPCCGKS